MRGIPLVPIIKIIRPLVPNKWVPIMLTWHRLKLPYDDTMNQPEADAWLEACQDELLSLKETQTYIPVSTDEVGDVNIVGCHWVFAIK